MEEISNKSSVTKMLNKGMKEGGQLSSRGSRHLWGMEGGMCSGKVFKTRLHFIEHARVNRNLIVCITVFLFIEGWKFASRKKKM